ncbi:hypothetical protein JKP88DRAFT_261960 [Tribonema minus]|uniref:Uncharacterized protein n=1 Tax=Tribonema minus TaxID=303371 RepID=A0A835ZFG6_9STRA|nr:hypothetical protein JKP88DRAFT_261960 [Tribonema minus]
MDPSSLLEWRETPGTTFWMLSSLVMTVATSQHWERTGAPLRRAAARAARAACRAGGLRMTKVNFHQRSVMKDREYWRAVTSALTFEKPNCTQSYGSLLVSSLTPRRRHCCVRRCRCRRLQVIIVLVMMFSLASQLERRLFRGRALTFVINLALIAVSLHLPGFYMKDLRMQFTSSVFAIAVTTWYALEFYNRPIALLTGILSIPAITLPFLMVGVRYFAEGRDVDRLRLNLVGVAAGVFMKARFAVADAVALARHMRETIELALVDQPKTWARATVPDSRELATSLAFEPGSPDWAAVERKIAERPKPGSDLLVIAEHMREAICANPQAAVRLRQERQQQAKQREEAATKANPNPKGEGADKPKDT